MGFQRFPKKIPNLERQRRALAACQSTECFVEWALEHDIDARILCGHDDRSVPQVFHRRSRLTRACGALGPRLCGRRERGLFGIAAVTTPPRAHLIVNQEDTETVQRITREQARKYARPISPIGASPRRKEDAPLLKGRGRYLDDLRRPGTAHLGVVRSLHAHARIRGIAHVQARAMPGVAVFTAADLPEVARGIPVPFGSTPDTRPYLQSVLASEVVRYVGEPVAVVVADDPYRLGDAMDGVVVDYDPLPPVMTLEAAIRGDDRVHGGWPDNAAGVARGGTGDVDHAFSSADLIVEERLRHPRLTAVPIEPRGVLAYRDPESGLLVVWSSTQNPYLDRKSVV